MSCSSADAAKVCNSEQTAFLVRLWPLVVVLQVLTTSRYKYVVQTAELGPLPAISDLELETPLPMALGSSATRCPGRFLIRPHGAVLGYISLVSSHQLSARPSSHRQHVLRTRKNRPRARSRSFQGGSQNPRVPYPNASMSLTRATGVRRAPAHWMDQHRLACRRSQPSTLFAVQQSHIRSSVCDVLGQPNALEQAQGYSC